MKLKFKSQAHQNAAVQAVIDCFRGQVPQQGGIRYRLDPGVRPAAPAPQAQGELSFETPASEDNEAAFRNGDLTLTESALLENIQKVQREQNLPISEKLSSSKISRINLDIEMETGTGKTYCYIKTIFELNEKYGWSKFIIVVPSIAIREGVYKSLQITSEHFLETYHKKARFFIYNSKSLHQLESFSSDAGINVMVINVQAFNATGKDARRIYEELDDFQSRRPIDVISANRPILILDEPQKMEGGKTLDSLANFKPLMILRYSATHKTTHNKIHRLDAVDAYQQKLVKKIAVRGISVRGLQGTSPYLYVESIEISTKRPPVARVEFEFKMASGEIKRKTQILSKGDNLYDLSKELNQYSEGYIVSEIDAVSNTVSFINGVELQVGEAMGDVTEETLRRIQIREAISAHLDREIQLFKQGIKVLTLFFIDEVAKYRDYSAPDEKGPYARVFEEEYQAILSEKATLLHPEYRDYLNRIEVQKTHTGYFSIDKKTHRLTDPEVEKRGENAGLSNDSSAYDLILKDKERLLSFEEPVRFLFSHSALREGWDNPNVFVICTLKQSDNTISRRQEVGRGLRLCVNQQGERVDDPSTVHDINVLTVVASESYKDFVTALQKDISESLSERPRLANVAYFTNKIIETEDGNHTITKTEAEEIEFYLIQNGYVNRQRQILETYHQAKREGTLAPLPKQLQLPSEAVFSLIDTVYSDKQLPEIDDDRKAKKLELNANFEKKEFQELWARINRKAAYTVRFDSNELVKKAVAALDSELRVQVLQYTIEAGLQSETMTDCDLKQGKAFGVKSIDYHEGNWSAGSQVKYDLIGKIAEGTYLTRRTVADILRGVQLSVFNQFKTNPEHFISEAIRLINEQKASMIVEHLAYDPVSEQFDTSIFTAGQTKQDLSNAGDKLERHIYDYVITDSNKERAFVTELDKSSDVVVYAKLPRGFKIPTPVGDYNPDWAISFKEGQVKHVYFVAETKGSMSTLDLRPIEKTKIDCARRFFATMNEKFSNQNVTYDVVDSFSKLMSIVK